MITDDQQIRMDKWLRRSDRYINESSDITQPLNIRIALLEQLLGTIGAKSLDPEIIKSLRHEIKAYREALKPLEDLGNLTPSRRPRVDQYQRTMLQAACLQAAAILLSKQPAEHSFNSGGRSAPPNTAECVKYAHDLFGKLTSQSWD